jgi:hypothetical protein
MSIIIACGANIAVQAAAGQSASQASRIISAILVALLALIGVIAGIVALCGIRRYGHKGLLWPAVTGICLWLLLFGLAVPAFLQVRKIAALQKPTPLRPLVHSPSATRVQDAEMGFSFDLPEGYEPFPPAGKPQGYRHAFLRQVANEPNRVLLVNPLGGTLGRQRLKPEEIPPGRGVSLTAFNWRGVQVDAIRVPEKLDDTDYLTFNVQIPLRRQAIQLGIGGPAESEPQLRALVEQVLSTLDGETNW